MRGVPAQDPFDARYALRARGVLAQFNTAGVLAAADVHVVQTLGRLSGEQDERVLLAVALAVRAVRQGSVCIDLHQVRNSLGDAENPEALDRLPWYEPSAWYEACRDSLLVTVGHGASADRPVRLIDDLLYLDRYWQEEQLVRGVLDERAGRPPPSIEEELLHTALQRVFPEAHPNDQRLAVAACVCGWLTVVAGGPGTGKTTTVARLLAVLQELHDVAPRVALAAPTGKAAARLQEAVTEECSKLADRGVAVPENFTASTLHRLLGPLPDSHSRFRFNRTNRLPYDVVVVDETSMVSLTLVSRLLEAVRPAARVVLLGDPDQLASVEAGAVLGDLVHRPPRPRTDPRASLLLRLLPDDVEPVAEVERELRNDVVRLRTTHRFGGAISKLAEAVRVAHPEAVLAVLRGGDQQVQFVEVETSDQPSPGELDGLRADVTEAGRAVVQAARAGDEGRALHALEQHRLLCAHRQGPYGVGRWGDQVERWLAAAIDGYGLAGEWYVGRPLLVTANDYDVGLYNGDSGVIVDRGPAGSVAAFGRGAEPLLLPPSRLSAIQTVHAMTVHRAQGSQFRRVSVLLPAPESPLLTRELFYTAVTRAREFVRVIGTEAAVRAAVTHPVVRASGLRRRLER